MDGISHTAMLCAGMIGASWTALLLTSGRNESAHYP